MDTDSPATGRLLSTASRLLNSVLVPVARYASLFFENTTRQTILRTATSSMLDRPAESRSESIEGLGVYGFSKEAMAHISVDGREESAWTDAALEVGRRLGGSGEGRRVSLGSRTPRRTLPADTPDAVTESEKEDFTAMLIETAFSVHSAVVASEVEYQDSTRRTLLVNSEGQVIEDARSMLGVRVKVTLRGPGGIEQGYASRGVAGGFGRLVLNQPERLALEALDRARLLMESRPIVSGTMPVVFAGGWSGLWLHEAFGHTLECDVTPPEWRSLLGKRLPVNCAITLIDDAVLNGAQGSLDFDDEGVQGRSTPLIQDGRLCALLTDRRRAYIYDLPTTGNGRCQDYRYPPLPRMTNLRLLPGSAGREDLIASVRDGVFVSNVSAGETAMRGGDFELRVLNGHRIEGGRITHPVRDLKIRGNAMSSLTKIRAVGSDVQLDDTAGRCVKAGQVVPIAIQAPPVLFDGLEVEQETLA